LLRLDAGRIIEQRSVGAPVGTVITVENLFFNTPARLKFLKSESTERRHIDTLVTRYAMAYPHVRFSLAQDGRETFTTSGTGELTDVLIEALGMDTMRDMLQVKSAGRNRPDLPEIGVYGFVSVPHVNRNTRNHITLFVNGRHIQDSSLTYAVSQAYHTLMPADRYPIAVLLINLPPSEVDVNVHPTKAEVRFRSPDAVFSAVQRAVRHTVVTQAPIPPTGQHTFGRNETFEEASVWTPPANALSPQPGEAQLDLELSDYDSGQRNQQRPPLQSFGGEAWAGTPPATYSNSGTISEGLPQRPRTLPPLRVVGQIQACYIVTEGPAGMYLIDQHAAHERILYEQFMLEAQSKQHVSQQALDTLAVELDNDAARLVEANLDALAAVGFDIEPFGGNSFKVRAVPSILANRAPEEAVIAILGDLELGSIPGEATLEEQIVLRVCKAAAIKAGQTLSYEEMQALVRQLERCESPRSCPHGRPTIIHMSAQQLAKEFGRT
jgi:DNA mismatch repair protein MutL